MYIYIYTSVDPSPVCPVCPVENSSGAIFSRNLYSEEKAGHMILTFQLWADEPHWLRGLLCEKEWAHLYKNLRKILRLEKVPSSLNFLLLRVPLPWTSDNGFCLFPHTTPVTQTCITGWKKSTVSAVSTADHNTLRITPVDVFKYQGTLFSLSNQRQFPLRCFAHRS